MVLDWDTLYGEAGTGVFESGKKRFYDNRVTGYNSGYEGGKFFAAATVNGEQEYHTKIIFDEQGGLYDYSCNCDVFSVTDGPCKHIVATALSFESKFPSAPIQPVGSPLKARSDAITRTLITEYSKRKHTRLLSSGEEKVIFSPILQIDSSDRLSLKFTIGKGRRYTLKDISDFASCMLSGAYRRYGVELEVVHAIENFDEKSKELVQFVIDSYREKVEFFSDYSNLNTGARDELKLLGSDVDNFIDMYFGQLVTFDDSNSRDGLRLIVNKVNGLNAILKVTSDDDGFYFTFNIPKFRTVAGKQYRYIITDSRIFRLTPDYYTCVMPLFKALEQFGKLFVSSGDMAVFYNSVISQVIDKIEISADGIDLSVFEAAPFVAKIYLNPIEGGGLSAELKCTYDDKALDILDENLITTTVRDWEAEGAFKRLLQKYFPYYPRLAITEEYDLYNFMSGGIAELFNYAEMFIAEEIKKMRVKKPPRIKVGVKIESGLLDVDLSAEDFSSEEIIAVLEAYREKKNYIRLNDGSFVDLIDPSIGALSEIMEVAQSEFGRLKLPANFAPFLDSELKSGFFSLERSGEFKKLVKTLSGADDSEIAVPSSLKDIMRNYQKTGFRWLKTLADFSFGGILADDMGLGKSIQIIALLKERKGTSIIVCPTTLILNWVNEFNKFAPELKLLPVMGSYEERRALASTVGQYDVVITSYELLRRDDEFYENFNFEYAVLDEAQYIKNPETKNAQKVKLLKSNHRFALTGTPVENSLAELWSIFDFIMPGYLYGYPRFKERYEAEIVRGNVAAGERLSKLVRPFILRRLKSGVLKELPPKIESNVVSALEGEQRQLYMANLSLIKESVNSVGENVNKVVVLSMLTKLRQICCEPRLVYPDYSGNSAKLEMCMELVTSAVESGHKILLFSQFTSMLDIIRQKLAESGISNYILKGDTPKGERMKLVNKFNEDATQVFLISLKAGGTGLNLTGADVVIHYDPWWNESVMNQATDRAYRIGQDKSVQVYKLILDGSIEQKILKLQEKKNALSGIIMGGGGSISYDDILQILE